jgi:hypothetical protein
MTGKDDGVIDKLLESGFLIFSVETQLAGSEVIDEPCSQLQKEPR